MQIQLRQVQLKVAEILGYAIEICQRHSLRYFMIGGTMLGAIRHKGFIPWDDDIDIALPRKDYDLFLKYAEEELPYPYKIYTHNGKHPCTYSKVHNVETTFVESSVMNYPEYYKGVFVDVMPLDGMPNEEKERKKFCKKIGNLIKAFNWHRFDFKYCKTLKAKLCYLIPEKLIFKKWEKLVKKYDFDSSEYTCFAWLHNPERYVFKTDYFKDLVDYEFEDLQVKGVRNYDGYLTDQFRDYMTLPPEEARQNHSSEGIVDLEKSYIEYKQKELKK